MRGGLGMLGKREERERKEVWTCYYSMVFSSSRDTEDPLLQHSMYDDILLSRGCTTTSVW